MVNGYWLMINGEWLLVIGAVKLGDGNIIKKPISTSTGQSTISINLEGQRLKKIRFEINEYN